VTFVHPASADVAGVDVRWIVASELVDDPGCASALFGDRVDRRVSRVADGIARRVDVRLLLRCAQAASPVEAIDAVVDEAAAALGALSLRFLVTDISGRAAVVYAGTAANAARVRQRDGRPELLPLPGTDWERVLRSQRPLRCPADPSRGVERVLVPVSDHGDALGVVDAELPPGATDADVAELQVVADVLAPLLVTCRRHTDLEDWAQASQAFSLAADIQRRLLPGSYSCETRTFCLSGWLEPANAVGGDTFDYAVERDTLHLAITDAVGHDVNAALLASVLVGSLRNSRRRGLTLTEQARAANEALAGNSSSGQFVTGQLVRVDLRTAELTLVNAGHPWPLLVRSGSVHELPLAIDLPFGVRPGRDFEIQRVTLEPGDRLVLLTDGMLERNAESIDLPALLAASASKHPRQVVYDLATEVLHHTAGQLRDDATVLCLDWHGTGRGAARSRA
jgi:serine phosphatase RsbU (regulator of sigma subunit)